MAQKVGKNGSETWPPEAIFKPPDATFKGKLSFRSEPPDANFPELKLMSRVSDKNSVEDLSVNSRVQFAKTKKCHLRSIVCSGKKLICLMSSVCINL